VDLAQRGVRVLLLDNDNTLSDGSRAICFAKRTLEIFDRLGCGDRMVDKGVSWNVGKVFFKQEQVYSFDLLPEAGHERPHSSTSSSTTSKATWRNALRSCRWSTCAGRTRSLASISTATT
jgi:2-polyprenyl-6-methoxyphenol hydroxylase-like FAD-dependent oxidoreductase